MSDYKTPIDKLITNEQAQELNACYKEKQNDGFGAENDEHFSCSSWYSLEDLEGYINYVKAQAASKKISVDGIRFYFGVYPENTEDKSKIGQNTLFMCPTSASKAFSKEDDCEGNSDDIPGISAMNYGNTGNPPKNDYGK
jgi:hypothetical protein